MAYPANTYAESVELTITASNQLHTILNGDSTTEVAVEDGSKIPSVRKAYTDSLFFLSPQPWSVGEYETVYNRLRAFIEPTGITTWWFSKTATVSTPILMSTTPHKDSNWTLWNAINNSVYETQKRLAAEAGLNMVGSFLLGATVTTTDDVVFYETDGKYYGWAGTFPKVVSAGATPVTSGGIGAGAWVDRTSDTLRTDLANSADGFGADLVKSKIGRAPTVMTRKVSDLLLDGEAGLRKNFGAKGDGSALDTSAFNDWWSCLMDVAYKRHAAQSGEQTWMLQKGPALLIENGQFIYDGNGLDITLSNSFVFNVRGESMLSTKIILPADKYLFDFANNPVHSQLSDLSCSGGRGLIRYKSKSRDVASLHIFDRLRVSNYTECGVANNSIDMPYFRVRDSMFYGDPTSETIGVCVSGLSAGGEVARNVFANNRYDIKLAVGNNGSEVNGPATPFNIIANDHYRTGDKTGLVHSVWIVPGATTDNAGRGIVFHRNKYGQENLKSPDTHILIADAAATGLTDSLSGDTMHSNSVSVGYVSGLKFESNNVNSVNAGYTAPFLRTNTPNVGNCRFEDIYDNGMPARIIDFHTSITQSQIQNLSRANVFDASQCIALQESTEPSLLSNLNGVFRVIDPLDYYAGHPQVPVKPAGQQQLNFAHLYAGPTSGIAVTSATKASINNSYGGVSEAAEITLTASDGRAVATVTGGRAGVRHWIDVELKRGSSNPVQSVKIEVLDSTGALIILRRKVLIDTIAKWQKFRIPYTPNSDGNILVRFKSDTYVAGTNTNFIVGNLNVYQNEEPINTGHNSGLSMSWSLQHDVKGARHEWYDASGNKRGKNGVPTSATDGVIISANAVV